MIGPAHRIARVLGTVTAALYIGALALPGSSPAAFPGLDGKIAFAGGVVTREFAIYTMSGRGLRTEQLTGPGEVFDPAFSADARWIAFTKYAGNSFELFKTRADGSDQRRLTRTRTDEEGPSFSPDGHTIVYDHFSQPKFNWDVYARRANGSHPVDLTDDPDSRDTSASFKPNGKRIVFVKDQSIARMRPNGSHQHVLRRDGANVFDSSPDYSPDGDHIVFERSIETSGGSGFKGEIYVMRADGSHLRRITHNHAFDRDPVFSPNGRRIAFAHGSPSAIYSMRTDGSRMHRLTEDGKFTATTPSWGPRR
jgi:TolB protein